MASQSSLVQQGIQEVLPSSQLARTFDNEYTDISSMPSLQTLISPLQVTIWDRNGWVALPDRNSAFKCWPFWTILLSFYIQFHVLWYVIVFSPRLNLEYMFCEM